MLYHPQVYWPDALAAALSHLGKVRLTYSQHAKRAATTDRHLPVIRLPEHVDASQCSIVEAEWNGATVTKVVLRTAYEHHGLYDIVLVLIPGRNLVKTVWLNHRNDNHKTLRKGRYVRG